MGISRDSMHKRRATGGKKKRKYELGRQPANTKLSSNKTVGHKKKGGKARKNMAQGRGERGKGDRVKVDAKMKKLFRKRARNYNSDEDDEVEEEEDGEEKVDISERAPAAREAKFPRRNYKETENETSFGEDEVEDERDAGAENEASDGEDDEILPGVTRFTEGCRAFRMAFKKIIKKTVFEDSIGPVLSAHKKLIAEKLAEDETERKTKGDAKKKKHLAQERGHVKPANYLDAHEKFLIGVATKGVVKLFNAVNKAQNAQKGLNLSRTKDAKTLNKRRKEAFFSEIGKRPGAGSSSKATTSSGGVDGEGPAWAPLRDNYMLTNSKLKDWDKMQDANLEDDGDRMSDSSSEDDY